ncbi:Peptidyl-prolyl cis-trans isomerase FKBP12 [Vitis vinifera]|uniref:peptidylprolyl isomerase n=1 Tax=Vitis vinifera TaxID=29760 RepID=A0A438HEB3_VITVI|nr:Peptidyl-prolyl cis-trans isomerase FKBP12 [Vitis vinifera]
MLEGWVLVFETRTEEINFNVLDVIGGWDEGVMGMQVGEVARLQCSPDYAYGPNGFPAWGIQPNSALVFEIEVLSLQ